MEERNKSRWRRRWEDERGEGEEKEEEEDVEEGKNFVCINVGNRRSAVSSPRPFHFLYLDLFPFSFTFSL